MQTKMSRSSCIPRMMNRRSLLADQRRLAKKRSRWSSSYPFQTTKRSKKMERRMSFRNWRLSTMEDVGNQVNPMVSCHWYLIVEDSSSASRLILSEPMLVLDIDLHSDLRRSMVNLASVAVRIRFPSAYQAR